MLEPIEEMANSSDELGEVSADPVFAPPEGIPYPDPPEHREVPRFPEPKPEELSGESEKSSLDIVKDEIQEFEEKWERADNDNDKKALLSTLERNLGRIQGLDATAMKEIIDYLLADRNLGLLDAFVLSNLNPSPAVREEVVNQMYQDIRSGKGADIRCDDIWEMQDLFDNCVPTTLKMVLSQHGIETSEGAVTAVALLDGWMKDSVSGVLPRHVGDFLSNLGLDNTNIPDATIEDLERYAEQNHSVMLAVDGDEVQGKDNDGNDQGRGVNHIILFLGVDWEVDPPMAIIHDSGHPGGESQRIPLKQLQDAWEDSGRWALRTVNPAPQVCPPISEMSLAQQNDNLQLD